MPQVPGKLVIILYVLVVHILLLSQCLLTQLKNQLCGVHYYCTLLKCVAVIINRKYRLENQTKGTGLKKGRARRDARNAEKTGHLKYR